MPQDSAVTSQMSSPTSLSNNGKIESVACLVVGLLKDFSPPNMINAPPLNAM